jgi:hypothetical protein
MSMRIERTGAVKDSSAKKSRHSYDFKRDTRNLGGHPLLKIGAHGAKHVPIDLRQACPPVDDQGEEGSCTANAGVGLAEFDMLRQGLALTRLSRQFLYWNTRNMEGTASDDAGATITDTVLAWAKYGICPEEDDPYIPGNLTRKPNDKAYIDAQPEAAQNYSRVDQTLESIYTCLAAGFPIIFGISVFESFEAATTGEIPVPDAANEDLLGGHAILIVGIDVAKNIVRFRNSWGTAWGDAGYGTLPLKEYVLNPDLASDFWVVKGIGAAPDVTPPAPAPDSDRARRGIVQSGFMEKVGDDSPLWKLADALEAAGDTVIRLAWTDDAGAAIDAGPIDYWINYSWGKAQTWHSLAKYPSRPPIANEFTIAGVACWLFGQCHGLVWHEFANIERAVNFTVSSFPMSDPIRDASAVEVSLSDAATGLPAFGRVNVNCDGLGLHHGSISGDARVHQAIIDAVSKIVVTR